MPTGYTAGLIEGKETPEQFMVKSLRAMGVAIMQRDQGLDAPLERRVLEDYYVDSVAKARAELDEVINRTDEQWKTLYSKQVQENAAAKSKAQVRYEIELGRIEKAIELVESKTYEADLQGWKKFMLEQLEMSKPYPVGDWYDTPDFNEWKRRVIKSEKRALEIAQESLTRQEEIVKGNNEWLDKVEKVLGREVGR